MVMTKLLGPIMVLVASITNKKKRKENPKKERKEERERECKGTLQSLLFPLPPASTRPIPLLLAARHCHPFHGILN